MASICLGLMVRDAEKEIERCIISARRFPGVDRAVLIDTGCIDQTVKVAREALDGLSVQFYVSGWQGHAHNRSELLEKVRESGADYCLMLDADMELVIEGDVPDLTADEYMIPIRDRGLIYPLPLLTSTSKRFYYHGVAHAYLACHDGPTNGVVLEQLALIDHGGGGNRPGKIERDAELLAAEVARNPIDARSWFYLAQSYRDLDRHQEAITCYQMRASLGGWSEEVYQSLYQAGALLSAHYNFYDGAQLLLKAAQMKPNRAEALRALAGCANAVANKIPQPRDEVLFVEPGAYRHQAKRPPRPEVEEIFFHRYTPKRGDIVVELGAAEGTETGLLSDLVGPGGRVLAVEPHRQTFAELLRVHGTRANVEFIQAAVAAKAGQARLSEEPQPWHSHLSDAGVKVKTVTLDRLTRDLSRIDLLKINIEGAEADVLAASPRTLAKTRNVVVSSHDFVGIPTMQRCREALEQAGFDVALHDEPLIIEDGHQGRCLGGYLYAARVLRAEQVSAVIVTRGDVALAPTLEPLPFDDVVIWDNSKRENLKTYGRVKAIEECANDIIFTVDDDVIFTAFDQLLAAYEPGVWVCNMDAAWVEGAGYGDIVSQSGAGSLYDRDLPGRAVERYLSAYPIDDDFLVYCDAVVGVLCPWRRVDLGYQVREFADGPGRTYTQPGANERKWKMINRALALKQANQAAA